MSDEYTVRDGIITDLGKFEGEPLYVPAFWEHVLDGFGDTHYDGDTATDFFVVNDEDRRVFPGLADVYGLALWETTHGFVECETFDSREAFDKVIEMLDESSEEEET
jgi:hypothetical protein